LIFVPSVIFLREIHLKTNQSEARHALMLILTWQKKIQEEKLGWSIGVITPFRAQIAAINHLGHLYGIDLTDVSIDTVERYQGGARDIIIMSCAVNSLRALTKISSVTPAGIDRKLNVAVTRARQQFILIGAEEIIKTQPAYSMLIEMSHVYQPEELPVREMKK
jgi:DNA replication ATP-dependent helicase Dna2